MSLFNRVKSCLPDVKAVLSDEEMLVINRRDFHITPISPVHGHLTFLGVKVSYPYRVLLSFLDQMCGGLVKGDFNIVLTDPSLSVAAYYCWMRSGGSAKMGNVYAPKGVAKFPAPGGFIGELIDDFRAKVEAQPDSRPPQDRTELFTVVLGNTKKPEQAVFAADRFAEAKRGLLVLKDYSRVDAHDEREYLETKKIFPAVTFEGHAFAIKT